MVLALLGMGVRPQYGGMIRGVSANDHAWTFSDGAGNQTLFVRIPEY